MRRPRSFRTRPSRMMVSLVLALALLAAGIAAARAKSVVAPISFAEAYLDLEG